MGFITSKADKSTTKDDSLSVAKPLTQQEDFCAELMDGKMDFSSLKDKQFLVAVSTGDRNKPLLLASTMRGPYEFHDMLQQVGQMWENQKHHAKAYVLTTDIEKNSSFLDEGTIDYIEAYWSDIISSEILEAMIFDEDEVIVPAGIILANPEDDE